MSPISLSVLLLVTGMAAAAADTVQFPANTDLDLLLVTPIDERATPVDQEIAFKVARELKKDGDVIAPKGADVTARVMQMQKQSSYIRNVKRTYYIVGLKLISIDLGKGPMPVTGGLETVGPTSINDYFVPLSHGPDKWGPFEEYRFQFKVPNPTPGESFLGVVREYLRVPKGLRMVFRTPEAQ
jgi:hypothetical protein